MRHEWTITTPAMGADAKQMIVVTCSACGESRTFVATPIGTSGRQIDLEGECHTVQRRRSTDKGGRRGS